MTMCALSRINKKLFTVIILVVMVLAIHGARFLRRVLNPSVSQEAIPAKAKGNPSAAIHVMEYSDFQCPACTYAAEVLKKSFERNPSKMYIEFRHYPLPSLHPFSVMGAVFSECAAKQGKFWEYHDRLFKDRGKWSRSLRVRGKLLDVAEDLGLEMESFRTCVEDTTVKTEVLDEKFEGTKRGVRATPTYFINDQMVVGGRHLKQELEKLSSEGKL